MKVGRNDPCPCGSGQKYKKCCLEKDEKLVSPTTPKGYEETTHPLTGDPMWRFHCQWCEVLKLIPRFLGKYPHNGYTLSIFNTLTGKTDVEIMDVQFEEIGRIVDYICHTEHAASISWIGVNSLSDSYVVAMSLTKGRIFGMYRVNGGKLVSLSEEELPIPERIVNDSGMEFRMNTLDLAMEKPNDVADNAFIEGALSELDSFISYVEQTHNVILLGDRSDFDTARRDWKHMTRIQVASLLSTWRCGIAKKYRITK